MTPLRLGVIGCGRLAREVHLPTLAARERTRGDVRVVAVADPSGPARGAALALAPAAASHVTTEALLAAGGLDAVVACPPTHLHATTARAVLAAGLPLYLEKPLAASLAEGEAVAAAAQAAGVPVMLGFNYRFNPLYAALAAHLRAGTVGEIVSVRTTFSTAQGAGPAWKRDRATGGGVLLDLAAHHVDLVRFLLGEEIASVGAGLWSRQTADDTTVLDLRTASGRPVQILCSLAAVEEDIVEVVGASGSLIADRYRSLVVEARPATAREARAAALAHAARSLRALPYLLDKRRSAWHEPSYALALDHFVTSVRGGTLPVPGVADGLRGLAVLEAAEAAARTGGRVPIAGVAPDAAPPRPDEAPSTADSVRADETTDVEAAAAIVAAARSRVGMATPLQAPPQMSALFVLPHGFAGFERTLAHLAAQSAPERLELVFVTQAGYPLDAPAEALAPFAGWQHVEMPRLDLSGGARAAAIAHARAPLAVPVEDHCWPAKGWLDGLLAPFERPEVAAVGPSFRNGNPATSTSWVDYVMNFGRYDGHARTALAGGTAWHNTAYRRRDLLSLGADLGRLLDVEGLLQEQLQARGLELVQSGEACVVHYNFSHAGWLLAEHAVNGKQFGAARSGGWSRPRRALYAAAFPLIPAMRVRSAWQEAARAGRTAELRRGLPALVGASVAAGVGEVAGYLFGEGRASARKFAMEYGRERYMTARDRAAFEAAVPPPPAVATVAGTPAGEAP